MFYYVRMEDIVPEDHLLRLFNKYIDFSFIREKVKHLYNHTGRRSIDPEVLLGMLLIGYLYGIISERRLCEEVKMHIGYGWFADLAWKKKCLIIRHFQRTGMRGLQRKIYFRKYPPGLV
jgi:transposase